MLATPLSSSPRKRGSRKLLKYNVNLAIEILFIGCSYLFTFRLQYFPGSPLSRGWRIIWIFISFFIAYVELRLIKLRARESFKLYGFNEIFFSPTILLYIIGVSHGKIFFKIGIGKTTSSGCPVKKTFLEDMSIKELFFRKIESGILIPLLVFCFIYYWVRILEVLYCKAPLLLFYGEVGF